MKIKLVVLAVILMAQVLNAETTTTTTCDSCERPIPPNNMVYYVDVQARNGFTENDAWGGEVCEVCIIVVQELVTNED